MRYAQNSQNFESTTSYATIWSDTDWNKTQKYVDKQRFRIFRAESEGETRKVRDLQRMSWIDIERHIMIKHNYSPLDKSKSDYFRQQDISTSRKLR